VVFKTRVLTGSDYPLRLHDLGLLPIPLYLHGRLPTGFAVAIVGTRHPTPESREFAHRLAYDFAKANVPVISGGAEGIDTAAHEGALAGGGSTLVVAPAAFDHPYPDKNRSLFECVVESGGGYLTPFPPGTPATRAQFFERNAYLAALSDALVVVHTRVRGGARNAAKAARSLSRPVFVVPLSPWVPMGAGCLVEIRLGARPVASARDVLTILGRPEAALLGRDEEEGIEDPQTPPLTLEIPQSCSGDPEQATIVASLRQGPKNLDELCALSGLSPGRLQALILTLTLEGIVVSDPSGRIRIGTR
jgi:DNA processing protein